MNIQIEWVTDGGYKSGYATTKSGKRAFIQSVQQSRAGRMCFSVYIAGDKRNAATRATLDTVMQILNDR